MDSIKEKAVFEAFNEYFGQIDDPRQSHKIDHLLIEVLFMSILAIIAGADDFEDMARWAKEKDAWLKTFLELPGGTPSHDTFNRVLCIIDASQFQRSFIDWMEDVRNSIRKPDNIEIINIDGKTVCGSGDKHKGKKAIHMVSALCGTYNLTLGQKKCYEKSNEITAIPALLAALLLEGTVITIDAMGCQKNIAKTIVKKKADYILALKENQPNLYKEVTDIFNKVQMPEFAKYIHQTHTEVDKGHGRIESRTCTTITNLDWLFEILQWEGIRSIAKVVATVIKNGKETVEERYYISSLNGNAKFINIAIRKHWHIENKLHWILDVIFREDYCRVRTGNGAENLNTIRKVAMNAFNMDNTEKCSLKGKRKKATWNDSYAMKIFYNLKTI
jgi:predicted transposase YbfD/YdcC